jgi:hypothetical protein
MEDTVKHIGDELRREATLDVLMHLLVAMAYEMKDYPSAKREKALRTTVEAIREAWARKH